MAVCCRYFLSPELILLSVVLVSSSMIKGPTKINGHVGEDAYFRWNTTDQGKILSVKWGIRKGDIADPQFINVNIYNNKVYKNEDLGEAFRRRIEFFGDLHKGRAWFKLKNLTVTDTNEYIASISDNVTRILPYYVRLEVKEKRVSSSIIKGPTKINGHVGEDAYFRWSTTDQGKILSVSWGIRKGNIADPQFINVNVYNNKVNKNEDLEEAFRRRIECIGDLHKGHAWFKLKNLTVTDTNEYIASISDDVTRVLPYYVRLEVKEKRVKPTGGSSSTTKTPTADYKQTAANNTEAAAVVNTTVTNPNNKASDHTLMTTVVVSLVLVLIFCVFITIIYLKKRKRSNKQGKENHKIQKEDQLLQSEVIKSVQ